MDISKVKLSNGTTLDIKDTTARNNISTLSDSVKFTPDVENSTLWIGEKQETNSNLEDTVYINQIRSGKYTFKFKEAEETDPGIISTIYIDESNSDGSHKVKITGDIAVNKDSNGNIIYNNDTPSVKSSSENVISWIRENSRKVYGVYDKDLKCLKIVDAASIGIGDDEFDTFMKLPTFWYRCTNMPTGAKLEFTHSEDVADDSWIKWDGDTFIGCYKARINGPYTDTFKNGGTYNTEGAIMRSSGYGTKQNTWFSWEDGRTITRLTGEGFSMVTYEAHQIMELLFYAYYGEVDALVVCGAGEAVNSWSNDNIDNGRPMDIVTFTDTKASNNPSNNHFWGLCDWWGNVYEWIDNIKILGGDENHTDAIRDLGDCQRVTVAILDYDGSIKRVIHDLNQIDDLVVNKYWGKYADVFPSECTYDYSDYPEGGYTVRSRVGSGSGCVAVRSGSSDYSSGGVGYLYVYDSPGSRYNYCGSRLQYTGPWVEVTSLD